MNNIHLLPTDKPSRLFIDIDDKKLKICVPLGGEHMMNQNIYITSDEEIKEGDWLIVNDEDVMQMKSSYDNDMTGEDIWVGDSLNGYATYKDNCKKIILTTDQDLIKDGVQKIDDEFLEWFVKNPSCESIYVEKLYKNGYGNWYKNDSHFIPSETKYKIIIPKEEPKQETIEEAADIERIAMDKLKNKWGHLYTFGYPQRPFPTNYENDLNNIKIGLYEGTKWQQEQDNKELAMWKLAVEKQEARCTSLKGVISDLQDKNKYSEKVETLWVRYRKTTNNEDAWSFKEWLVEQFKNK